jgi:uroporphyrinogen III methyltransferase/synthase
MSRSRVLVVRSGAIPGMAFPKPRDPDHLEVVETISHAVAPLPSDDAPFREPADLAVFTSQIAAGILLGDPARLALFRRSIAAGKVAAIGEATAATLREGGISPDIVAAGSGASVLDRLPARLDGWRVLLPRGEDATEDLPEGLAHRGARLAPVVLYRKTPVARPAGFDREILERPFSAFATTAPSAAMWLFSGATPAAVEKLRATPAVVLGRFTARYLENHGVVRVEIAREPSFSAVLDRLEELAAAAQPA